VRGAPCGLPVVDAEPAAEASTAPPCARPVAPASACPACRIFNDLFLRAVAPWPAKLTCLAARADPFTGAREAGAVRGRRGTRWRQSVVKPTGPKEHALKRYCYSATAAHQDPCAGAARTGAPASASWLGARHIYASCAASCPSLCKRQPGAGHLRVPRAVRACLEYASGINQSLYVRRSALVPRVTTSVLTFRAGRVVRWFPRPLRMRAV